MAHNWYWAMRTRGPVGNPLEDRTAETLADGEWRAKTASSLSADRQAAALQKNRAREARDMTFSGG